MEDTTKLKITPLNIMEMVFDMLEVNLDDFDEPDDEMTRLEQSLIYHIGPDEELQEFYSRLQDRLSRLVELGLLLERDR